VFSWVSSWIWTNDLPSGAAPSWSNDSWIYKYPCNQCLSPLQLWV